MAPLDKDEYVTRKLKRYSADALSTLNKVSAELTKSLNDAEYRLRWLDGLYEEVAMAQWCERALEGGVAAAVRSAKQHLEAWSPERSTSRSANACSLEKYAAMKKFVQEFEALDCEEEN